MMGGDHREHVPIGVVGHSGDITEPLWRREAGGGEFRRDLVTGQTLCPVLIRRTWQAG